VKDYWFALPLVILAGCTAKPVLYPNAHYKQVGNDQAKADIEECRLLAKDYVKSHKAMETAGSTVEGGAIGGAMGAAGGAIVGSPGIGAGVGAAAGAAGSLISSLFHTHQPKPIYKHFVDHCLVEKHYDVVGWQ
jgi:hypothetical protein